MDGSFFASFASLDRYSLCVSVAGDASCLWLWFRLPDGDALWNQTLVWLSREELVEFGRLVFANFVSLDLYMRCVCVAGDASSFWLCLRLPDGDDRWNLVKLTPSIYNVAVSH